MTGLEQMAISMLQKMTGLNPEQMQQLAAQAIHLLQTIEGRMAQIESDIAEIKAYVNSVDAPIVPQIEDKTNVKNHSN